MADEHAAMHAMAGEPLPSLEQDESGLRCLLMMAQYHGLRADPAKLRHEYGQASFDTTTLLHAAKTLGFSAKLVRQPVERLHKAPLPCLALDTDGRFFILAKVDTSSDEASRQSSTNTPPSTAVEPPTRASRLLIQRPGEPPSVVTEAAFTALWSGGLIFLTSKASFAGEVSRFDFSWFIPAVVKYRKQPIPRKRSGTDPENPVVQRLCPHLQGARRPGPGGTEGHRIPGYRAAGTAGHRATACRGPRRVEQPAGGPQPVCRLQRRSGLLPAAV